MAQTLYCDVCEAEPALQVITNTQDGSVMVLGGLCMGMFYAQAAMTLLDVGEHKGPPTKCQACRRLHEKMTTPATPIGVEYDNGTGEIPGQLTVDDAVAEP